MSRTITSLGSLLFVPLFAARNLLVIDEHLKTHMSPLSNFTAVSEMTSNHTILTFIFLLFIITLFTIRNYTKLPRADNLWQSPDEKPRVPNSKNEGPSQYSGASLEVRNIQSSTRRTWRLVGRTRLFSSLTSGLGGAPHHSALLRPPAQDSRPDQRKAQGCLRMLGDKKGSCPDKKGS